MKEYHKIDSVYKRNERGKLLFGQFSKPEFEYLKDLPWQWTEKIDGTNIRIMWDGRGMSFGGKTDNAQIPAKLINNLNSIFNPSDDGAGLFTDIFGTEGNVCLYGEGYGAGIQSGGNYSPDQKFILFDVKVGDWWLEPENIADIANKLGIDMVPYHGTGTLEEVVYEVMDKANNPPRSRYGTALIEGYVGTPIVQLFNRKGERIITKVKYKDFKDDFKDG